MQDWKAHVVGAQRGDLAAFEQVVRRFEDMAVGYAYSVLGDFQLAEDAAQEAFVQAYLDLRMLQEPQAFPAWLRRIVFKQCDRFSRRKRLPTVSLEAGDELPAPGPTVLEEVQQRETRDEVLAAVSALPENERTATTLFYIDGYSLAEVGEFLEVPVSTVKSRLHTARRQLRERMMGRVEETLRRHAPGEEFLRRVRHVLKGVPRVGFYAGGGDQVPEDVPFPSSLAACLRFLGEEYPYLPIQAHGKTWRLNYATVYIMGTSGLAFGFLWKPGWHEDNADLMHIVADPEEIVRRAFQAVGYGYELIHKKKRRGEAAYFRRRIVESIRDKRRPVLGFGIVGPPECCIITGYDDEGEILLGWSYFQDMPGFGSGEREPSGYFRRRGWFEDTWGLIIVGEKQELPPLGDIYRATLQWALEIARTPMVRGRHSGFAAYAAWAGTLLRDEDFPAGDREVLRERHRIHDTAVGTVAEGRWYGAQFLRQMVLDEPAMAGELQAAAACYELEHDLMWEVWGLAGGRSNPEAHLALAEPGTRRRIAALILQARDKDVEAAAHLEAALARQQERERQHPDRLARER